MKKPEYINISYQMGARYLVSNYMHGVYSPLRVVAYPDAKKLVTPSDDCPNPVHWRFHQHKLLDVETISACGEVKNGVVLKSEAVVNVLNEMSKDNSYTDASALFMERIAKAHGCNTDGLWCRATPRLKRFIANPEG